MMKRIKPLLLVAALITGVNSVAMAQSATATIEASATVISDITVTSGQDIDFGDIIVGTAKFISAFNQSTTLENGNGTTGNEQVGWFEISVTEGVNVDLTLDVPVNLTDAGSNTLPISFDSAQFSVFGDLNGLVTADDPSSATNPTAVSGANGADFTPNNGGTNPTEWTLNTPFTMPTGGTAYLVLGGQVSAGESQAVASYDGTITLTATITD